MTWGVAFRIGQVLKSSLWIVPFAGGVLGLVVAALGLWLDAVGVLPAWEYSPESATALLSATIGATASLTGFVVTVTVLGVQMATGTFSPRYMRLWYRDGMLKVLLAELIGTLTLAFSVIRQVGPDMVPDLSVSLAAGGVIVGLLLFMLFFDRFLHRMRPVSVAALMASACRETFEEALREGARPDTQLVARGAWGQESEPLFVVRATQAGTIQAADTRELSRFARRHGCLLVFRRAIGDFVPVGGGILEVHGTLPPPQALNRLCSLIAFGVERTIEQDPSFAIRIMVDVATRALSPAVNDPTTAVQVLDHLGETLRMIGTAPLPAGRADGIPATTGVVMPIRTWPEVLSLAVTEIRMYGADSVQVARRLRALLQELDDLVLPENRQAVRDELRRLDATVAERFGGTIDEDLAFDPDAQGLGGPAMKRVRSTSLQAARP
ncbi:MAG TPA: DUF2254 domain-containing protein [Candidatus Limnocylindrales bacterium]|nr:DUF2254 domain-containing protein [Candidatus Limnocylindrales bacterium]